MEDDSVRGIGAEKNQRVCRLSIMYNGQCLKDLECRALLLDEENKGRKFRIPIIVRVNKHQCSK